MAFRAIGNEPLDPLPVIDRLRPLATPPPASPRGSIDEPFPSLPNTPHSEFDFNRHLTALSRLVPSGNRSDALHLAQQLKKAYQRSLDNLTLAQQELGRQQVAKARRNKSKDNKRLSTAALLSLDLAQYKTWYTGRLKELDSQRAAAWKRKGELLLLMRSREPSDVLQREARTLEVSKATAAHEQALRLISQHKAGQSTGAPQAGGDERDGEVEEEVAI